MCVHACVCIRVCVHACVCACTKHVCAQCSDLCRDRLGEVDWHDREQGTDAGELRRATVSNS